MSIGSLAVVFVIVLVLAMGLGAWIGPWLLLKPIRHLTEAAKHWSAGDFAARIDLPKHGELGRLGQAFNAMAAKTEERQKAMEKALMRLEAAKRASRLGVYDFDLRTGQLEWDDRMRELWGLPADETVTYDTFLDGL